MSIFIWLLRSFIGFALLPAALGVIYAGAGFIAANAAELLRSPFTWGFALMSLPAAVLARRVPLTEILEHEFGHYAMSVALGKRPIALEGHRTEIANDIQYGGVTAWVGRPFGASLIALAPYFLPLLTLPFLLVRPLISPSVQPIIDFLIGATLIWHFITVFAELWQGQKDITDATLLLSTPVILIANMVISVVIMVVVLEAWGALLPFLQEAWTASVAAYRTATEFLVQITRNMVDTFTQWV